MNVAYVFKGNILSPSELSMEIVKNLPQTYFPDFDVYFDPEDAYDVEIIEQTFKLSELKEADFVEIGFRDSLNLHFRQGKNIGFGEGDIKVVGDFLACFGSLYEEVVTDKHKGIERNKKLNKSQREDFALEKPLNISGLIAASLSIIVKPKTHVERIKFEENIPTTDSEETFIRISNLIKNSLDIEKILTIKDLYNSKVFDKLEKIGENIKENELSVDFKHISIKSSEMFEVNLNPSNSSTMIANIKRIYEDTSIPEEHEGTFDMLHCGTGHFSFKSNTERFRGYFEKELTDLTSLDFKTVYCITINRTTKKGKQDNIKIIGINTIEDF